MNTEFFIARRIFFDKQNHKSIAQSIVKIAVAGIALGMVVMILAVAISTGFQNQVWNKVVGFGSHIVITNHDSNASYEMQPVSKKQDFYPSLSNIKGIKHIQVFATKAGILKTKNDIQGVVLKGVGQDFDWNFFDKNLIAGKSFRVKEGEKTNKVLISKYLSDVLKINVGDSISMFFIQEPPRARRFVIEGIYQTGLEEYDHTYLLCDMGHIQKLNDWKEDIVGGFEVLIDDYEHLDEMTNIVYDIAGTRFNKDGSKLLVRSIKEVAPQIFDWLKLTDTNVVIIIALMTLVAGFNMISSLLILILERINMVGILKAIGTSNGSIQKIFLYNGAFLIGKGLLWGNLIGVLLCLIQYYFQIIKLDSASYYVSYVPINLKIIHLVLLNIGTLIITTLMLVIPSFIIGRIRPVQAIRFN